MHVSARKRVHVIEVDFIFYYTCQYDNFQRASISMEII